MSINSYLINNTFLLKAFTLSFLYPSKVKTFKRLKYNDFGELVESKWSGRRDLNPRPQPWQGCALPLSYARDN